MHNYYGTKLYNSPWELDESVVLCHNDGYLKCAHVENEIPFFVSPV